MKTEAYASKQAKRYNEDERRFFINEYQASGLSLTKFCRQLGKPSYQIMRGWMISGNNTSIMESLIAHSALQGQSVDIQYHSKEDYIESLYRRLADIKVQIDAIKQELDSLEDYPA